MNEPKYTGDPLLDDGGAANMHPVAPIGTKVTVPWALRPTWIGAWLNGRRAKKA